MSYFDEYPGCINCPVSQYCGTVVSSVKLCHSYNDSIMEKEVLVLAPSKAASG